MKVNELLKQFKAEGFFILDSHQEAMKQQDQKHKDRDFESYSYNIHRYNKLKVGSMVLFRRPKKSSAKRKFYLYGGAVIKNISVPDAEGFVDAELESAFKFLDPIYEDDKVLIEFRNIKKSGATSWVNFWNQYGMNQIKESDFKTLIEDRDCILASTVDHGTTDVKQIAKDFSEEEDEITNIEVEGFTVDFSGDGQREAGLKENVLRKRVGKHVNFDKLNRKNKTLGTAGELLVLNSEIEKLSGTSYEPRYSADLDGDGLGYDIKSYELDGTEVHIEVKTTTSNKIDGFFMSDNELKESQRPGIKYKIYRVYNFNEKDKTANIEVYDGPVSSKDFKVQPVSYKIYLK